MERRVEVFTKANFPDAIGNEVASEIANIGITSVDEIRTVQVYLIDGELSKDEIKRICSELLIDGLTQDYVPASMVHQSNLLTFRQKSGIRIILFIRLKWPVNGV